MSSSSAIVASPGSVGAERTQILVSRDAKGQPVHGIAKTMPDGRTIVATQVRVQLDPAKKHVWELTSWLPPEEQGGKFRKVVTTQITAAGYDHINKYLGIIQSRPRTVAGPDGRIVQNPYIQRDEHGTIRAVTMALIGVGRNAIGNLTALEYSLHYDLHTYLVQDILSRWTGKKSDATCKVWGQLYPGDQVEQARATYPRTKLIRIGDDLLAVDLTNKEVINIIAEHQTRVKFAERLAQTICWRNIMKKLTGEAVVTADMSVSVNCWITPDGKIADALADAQRVAQDMPVERVSEIVDRPESPALLEAGDIDVGDENDPQSAEEPEPGSIAPIATAEPDFAAENETALADMKAYIRSAHMRDKRVATLLVAAKTTLSQVRDSTDFDAIRDIANAIRELPAEGK